MTTLFLAALTLAAPDVHIILPDTVQTGEVFQCEITVEGQDLSNVACVPVYSEGLEHMGTGSMHSFSSVSTPSGTRVSSSTVLTMRFAAWSPGTHTLGPFSITSSGRVIYTSDEFTVTALGAGSSASVTPREPENEPMNALAWMEVAIDTTGRIYPGQTFNVDYYICKSVPSAEVVDLFLEPADYATSRLTDDIEQLQWVRDKNGVYRTWLATMAVTPAFACTLSLPVLRGRIGLPGGMIRPSREYLISSEGATIPVYPFPEHDMPDNFTGVTGEVSFSSERVTRGYSSGGERCIKITARGPGSSRMEQLPQLTVNGPASVRPGRCTTSQDGARSWFVLVEPSDSGNVVIGPDSLAWFDTGSEVYRQAIIPPCTLSVYPISLTDADLSFLEEDDGNSALFWVMTVSIMLLASTFLILRYRNRVCIPADVMDAGDVEELLTVLGDRLSMLLTGSRCYMGSEELDEILDQSSVDVILSRRLLRHWKDLELMLSSRTVSADQLGRLKNKSRELLGEVSAEIQKG